MKKLVALLFAVVVMMVGTPTEAAHQWIHSVNTTNTYVDDTTAIRDGKNSASVVIISTKGDLVYTQRVDVWFENDYVWVYGIKGHISTVTYDNYSGYLKDWLMNNGYLY